MTLFNRNSSDELTKRRNQVSVIREPRVKMSGFTATIRTAWWSIVIKPGALGMLIAMIFCAGFLIASQRMTLTGEMSLTWYEAVIAGLLAMVSLVLHENGHAVAGRFTGRNVLWLQFGMSGGAVTSGDSTPIRRMIAIAAGPLTEIAFGAVLFSLGGGQHWDNALGAAGFMALLNGIGNLLPLHKSLDGYKFLKFAILALRGNKPLVCAAEGPCPACTGASIPAPVEQLEVPVSQLEAA